MMGLALFDGCNYILRRESPETQREFVQHGQGKVTTGWEMMVPPPGSEFERQWKGRGLVDNLVQGPCGDPELTHKVQAISAEPLLIWGRLDGIVPLQHGKFLRATLPHAKLDVIDRCDHLPMVEKPETFHRLLYDFLLSVEEEIPDVVKV
jgi:pimeloyl-ACP methyl ester carboxylesterase